MRDARARPESAHLLAVALPSLPQTKPCNDPSDLKAPARAHRDPSLLGGPSGQSNDLACGRVNAARAWLPSPAHHHVSPGRKDSRNVTQSLQVNTLLKQFAYGQVDGSTVEIRNDANGYANIVAVDIKATNGIIHVLDGVLLP